MAPALPEYYKTLIDIQPGFFIGPDPTRRLPAVLEHLDNSERLSKLTEEISRISPEVVENRLNLLELCFEGIPDVEEHLLQVFDRYFGDESPLNGCTRNVKIAAASAMVQAFPYEGLACFNPTIVRNPKPSESHEGSVPVILALRSYGEYHRSSISFRTGVIDGEARLHLDEPERTERGFTKTYLPKTESTRFVFPQDGNPSNFVLYAPFILDLQETWEDVRFTPFADEGEYGGAYLGTFTSFHLTKRRLQPSVLITRDFRTFDYHVLRGSGAKDKDMAYFPRRIKNRYAMLSRNNGRDLFLMTSDDPLSFNKKKMIAECRPDSFDAHKIGVCAPPIETPQGWLVLYHGVADPGQIYSLGVMLLDLEDPSMVIARLPYTLHCPLLDDQIGMLTHINYTCGAILHEYSGNLVVPFACNDSSWKVGRIGLDELLARLMDDGQVKNGTVPMKTGNGQ